MKLNLFFVTLCAMNHWEKSLSNPRECISIFHPECLTSKEPLHVWLESDYWTITNQTKANVCKAIMRAGDDPGKANCENKGREISCKLCFTHSFMREWSSFHNARDTHIIHGFNDHPEKRTVRCSLMAFYIIWSIDILIALVISVLFAIRKKYESIHVSLKLDLGLSLVCLLLNLVVLPWKCSFSVSGWKKGFVFSSSYFFFLWLLYISLQTNFVRIWYNYLYRVSPLKISLITIIT